MQRRLPLAVVVLVAVVALLASGCFAVRGFSLTRSALSPGQATTVRLELKPYASGAVMTSDKVFILVGWSNADRRGKVKFDALGNWGGPYDGKNTLSLATHLLTAGVCAAYGLDASELEGDFDNWEAWHTTVPIDGTGLTYADFSASLRAKLRVQRPAAAANGQTGSFVVFSGGWSDLNNSNTWNAGEQTICTAAVFFDIPFVG